MIPKPAASRCGWRNSDPHRKHTKIRKHKTRNVVQRGASMPMLAVVRCIKSNKCAGVDTHSFCCNNLAQAASLPPLTDHNTYD